ncbi:MAG: hypothetical protein P8I94_11585, partial [Emcibacteraceae bacterium]|nr:hypothetical protein [Emcibacteraceae bacterium]
NQISLEYANDMTIRPKGFKTAETDFQPSSYAFFYNKDSSDVPSDAGLGVFRVKDTEQPYYSESGGCFALPIALVSRRAEMAYHPTYAPQGCGVFSDGNKWQNTTDQASNEFDCL